MALDVKEGTLSSILDQPVIPDTFPAMPTPRRNVCWALREMRDRFERRVVRWIQRQSRDGDGGYCLVGLAREVSYVGGLGDSRLYQATIYQVSRAIAKRLGIATWPEGSDSLVMGWNDNIARSLRDVCEVLADAEAMAERDGACEP